MTQYEIIMGATFEPSEDEIVAVIEAARRDVRYLVTDYPVELLVSKFKEEPQQEGDIYIPEYQRKLRWTDQAQSYFIESVILRIPVPPIFFYDVKGRLEIVDGSQRVRTLARFVNDDFALGELEKLDILSGLKYSQLPSTIQKRLFNTPSRLACCFIHYDLQLCRVCHARNHCECSKEDAGRVCAVPGTKWVLATRDRLRAFSKQATGWRQSHLTHE
jgi:Protein of unknown function DUF262